MKITPIIILVFSLFVSAIIIFSLSSENNSAPSVNNVSIVDGKQIIIIKAKGGYYPKVTNAKAGIATVIKMDTIGTFDCSSAVVIPSLSYRKNLAPSAETLIDVLPQKPGAKLQGLCAMGMYSFTINFD